LNYGKQIFIFNADKQTFQDRIMNRPLLLILIVISCSTILVGCFPGGEHYQKDTTAGFFSGVWHGWIAPISLIVGLFKNDIRIYEPNNTGWWYDLGFYTAIIGGFGGIALSRKKLKKTN
jgi:polyferredoxin